MSSCGFSIHDIRFRRTRDDECAIVVHGQTVGTVMRRPDIANPDGDLDRNCPGLIRPSTHT